MILSMKPLTLAEVRVLAGDLEHKIELRDYLKEFCPLDEKKAEELANAIRGLNNPRIKEDLLIKVVDFLPRDSESLSKIFNDVSLDEKEMQEVLAIVKDY